MIQPAPATYRQDAIALLKAGGTCVTPTLMTALLNGGMPSARVLTSDDLNRDDLRVLYPPTMLSSARRTAAQRANAEAARSLEINMATVKSMVSAGIRVVTGTDVPSPRQEAAVHAEMQLMVAAGLTPVQALRAATLDAATCARLDQHLGSVDEGKLRDLVLIDGDPTADITASRRISHVILGGDVFTPAEIIRIVARGNLNR